MFTSLRPFLSRAVGGSFLQHLIFIVETVLPLLERVSQEMGVHDFGQSICQLCSLVHPPKGS
jgi:hypothetical protein